MNKKIKLSKEEIRFKIKFYELMFELDLYNKFKKTYHLDIKEETEYGFYAYIHLQPGLSFKALIENKKIIEENLQCLWIMKQEQFKSYAKVNIVTKPLDESIEFQSPKIKPWQTYLGLSFAREPIIIDNNKHCMSLLAGATGSGKTRYIYMILLSWILSCTPQEVALYIADIVKSEYINFKNVAHVRFYAETLDELQEMMESLNKEFERRKRLIGELRENELGTNIKDYNKANPRRKLPYCYLLIDELSIVNVDYTDSKEEKEKKRYILDTIKRLEKTGRSLGMFCFMATQKTSKEEMPIVIKDMSAVRISFRANDGASSLVVMGDDSAEGLMDRVAVYSLNGGADKSYLFSPTLTMDRLNSLLKPYKKPLKRQSKNKTKGGIKRLRITTIPKEKSYKDYLPRKEIKEDYDDY